MKIDILNEDNEITRVVLNGRLDIAGANAIDMQFSVISGSRKKVIVDLANVDFLASMGMRILVVSAKTIANKGGRMVLLNPQPSVDKVLRTSGIDTVIPIVADFGAANAMLG